MGLQSGVFLVLCVDLGSYGGGFNCVTILFSNCVDVCIPFFGVAVHRAWNSDTQCGFKMFTRSAARIVFHNLNIERWAFDVELLYIAQKLKMPIDEVAVYWTEIEGSKVTSNSELDSNGDGLVCNLASLHNRALETGK
ncbi:Dolichyl-phosphate beta-glucosyltransferase [Orchesella cincta]|uniref:Dolichyl-phosphate beta-glucosyltransferase n=1 Tax=Orchesella cincta TaxID=48709 RepID=A0A1D2M9G9_ORCCI|nr:Dolichyl-phosphate beta-glucosyltransferase [Orchesella cincta]